MWITSQQSERGFWYLCDPILLFKDMKKFTTLLLGFLFSVAMAQAPAGYYNGTEGLTGAALKTKLSQIITAGALDKGYDGLYTAYPSTDSDHFYEND